MTDLAGQPDWADEKAKEIAANNPLVCGPCGGPLPNPECPHPANGTTPCCIPAGEDMEAAIATALREAEKRGQEAMRERAATEAVTSAFSVIDLRERMGPFTIQDRATESCAENIAAAIRALTPTPAPQERDGAAVTEIPVLTADQVGEIAARVITRCRNPEVAECRRWPCQFAKQCSQPES